MYVTLSCVGTTDHWKRSDISTVHMCWLTATRLRHGFGFGLEMLTKTESIWSAVLKTQPKSNHKIVRS